MFKLMSVNNLFMLLRPLLESIQHQYRQEGLNQLKFPLGKYKMGKRALIKSLFVFLILVIEIKQVSGTPNTRINIVARYCN